MEFIETESYDLSQISYDDVSVFPEETYDDSLFTQPIEGNVETGADVISVPAIIEDYSSEEQAQSHEGVPDQAEQTAGGGADPEQSGTRADGFENQETLGSIYKLLQERLPEGTQEESESESELESESEIDTEKSLSDIYDEISKLNSVESEQLEQLKTINNNLVVHSNNSYYFDFYTVSIISAIWGSIAIFLLFRKIG